MVSDEKSYRIESKFQSLIDSLDKLEHTIEICAKYRQVDEEKGSGIKYRIEDDGTLVEQ